MFKFVFEINYAYTEDGIICYPDLVKVSVSLSDGKAVAFDSRGYLMNHRKREADKKELSVEKCRKILSPALSVISSRTVFIPLETGKEALCYEFHCKGEDGKEVLVYINAQSGKEENVLLLLYSGSSHDRFDPCLYFKNIERLCYVIICAILQSQDLIHVVTFCSKHHDRHIGKISDMLTYFKTVHLRKHNI